MVTANQDGDAKPVKRGTGSRQQGACYTLSLWCDIVEMQLEPVPIANMRDCCRQGNNPLVKGGAQHSAGCDSHIK
eukprot:3869242-Ditylum_brightwellii.AAC.1